MDEDDDGIRDVPKYTRLYYTLHILQITKANAWSVACTHEPRGAMTWPMLPEWNLGFAPKESLPLIPTMTLVP
ncbi:unnamed protein product [Haemonchus placei]|uniref:Uncharacterized protein n=1 Tax=Haemonchus placei TaxID=6290 RepID=A0A0N4X6U8_HAEPC|nr:unnamed protein product [Haemonchus placei]